MTPPPDDASTRNGDNSLEMNLLETAVSNRDHHHNQSLSCFTRFRAELLQCCSLRTTRTFCIRDRDTDQIIDVTSSFYPIGFPILLWKAIVVLWILSCLILGIQDQAKQGHAWMYLVFLTNWGITVSLLYMICSFFNSAVTTTRQQESDDNESSCPSRWICFTWIVFEIAAHTEIAVTIMYWSTIREPGKHIVYAEYTPHGIVGMLVLIDGLLVNRIPVRLSHLWQFVIWFDLLYMIFTAVYEFSGIGNGPLYPTVQWKDDFTGTLVRDILALTILCPILYILLYAVSVLPCRRYLHSTVSTYEETNASASESDN